MLHARKESSHEAESRLAGRFEADKIFHAIWDTAVRSSEDSIRAGYRSYKLRFSEDDLRYAGGPPREPLVTDYDRQKIAWGAQSELITAYLIAHPEQARKAAETHLLDRWVRDEIPRLGWSLRDRGKDKEILSAEPPEPGSTAAYLREYLESGCSSQFFMDHCGDGAIEKLAQALGIEREAVLTKYADPIERDLLRHRPDAPLNGNTLKLVADLVGAMNRVPFGSESPFSTPLGAHALLPGAESEIEAYFSRVERRAALLEAFNSRMLELAKGEPLAVRSAAALESQLEQSWSSPLYSQVVGLEEDDERPVQREGIYDELVELYARLKESMPERLNKGSGHGFVHFNYTTEGCITGRIYVGMDPDGLPAAVIESLLEALEKHGLADDLHFKVSWNVARKDALVCYVRPGLDEAALDAALDTFKEICGRKEQELGRSLLGKDTLPTAVQIHSGISRAPQPYTVIRLREELMAGQPGRTHKPEISYNQFIAKLFEVALSAASSQIQAETEPGQAVPAETFRQLAGESFRMLLRFSGIDPCDMRAIRNPLPGIE